MHTIKPTTLPFNPEHHIALEIEIVYNTVLLARDGLSIHGETSKSHTFHARIVKEDAYFIFNAFCNPEEKIKVEGIEDTAAAFITGIETDDEKPAWMKLSYQTLPESQKTNFPAEYERNHGRF